MKNTPRPCEIPSARPTPAMLALIAAAIGTTPAKVERAIVRITAPKPTTPPADFPAAWLDDEIEN